MALDPPRHFPRGWSMTKLLADFCENVLVKSIIYVGINSVPEEHSYGASHTLGRQLPWCTL